MKSRYMVLGLSLVLALALAVPALGGPTNPLASSLAGVKKTAKKALKTAKAAQSAAEGAQKTANSAQSAANNAQKTATAAQGSANTAQTLAKNAQKAADEGKAAAAAAQSTANSKLGTTFSEFGSGSGPNATTGLDIVSCPTGSQVTGGGYNVSGTGANEVVPLWAASYGNAWLASMKRIPGGTNTWSVQAIVVCAKP
jgi:hypothetical protein